MYNLQYTYNVFHVHVYFYYDYIISVIVFLAVRNIDGENNNSQSASECVCPHVVQHAEDRVQPYRMFGISFYT